MIRVGLVGDIGSGKSFLAKKFNIKKKSNLKDSLKKKILDNNENIKKL